MAAPLIPEQLIQHADTVVNTGENGLNLIQEARLLTNNILFGQFDGLISHFPQYSQLYPHVELIVLE